MPKLCAQITIDAQQICAHALDMNTKTATKKQPSAHAADWHPADIIAALRKSGWSLRRLSIHHGYYHTYLAGAIERPFPKGERLIAAAIGVPPEQIWPSRYAERAARKLTPRQRQPSATPSTHA